ncbi:MAG: HPr family phosphocarrier protein [Acholeplasmataceae bacterium]|nr:HPr family phosphocarrier protein [Acholeplasmataceae bacterium]
MKKNFVVVSEKGIHARPATELVIVADQFMSEIKVTANNRTIDMKSIMGLMSLGMYRGQSFTLEINGGDEQLAMEKIKNLLIENGLAKIDE